jgi:energy-converting hydrogenase Eha subunit A
MRRIIIASIIGAAIVGIAGFGQHTAEAAGPWTTKATMPTPRGGLGVAVVNGILYAVGGVSGGGLNAVEAYDPGTNTWTTKAAMPTPRAHLGVGVVNGILYAVGGTNGLSGFNTVEAYNPVTNTWTTKASMPTARIGLGIAAENGIL